MPDSSVPLVQQHDQRRHRDQLRDGFRTFIDARRWDHFCTLTSKDDVTDATPWRRFHRGVARMEPHCRRRIDWVAFLQKDAAGRPHLHALLHGSAGAPGARLEAAWSYGHARVTLFDPRRRAADYLSKSALTGDPDWDCSDHLPPLRTSRRVRRPVERR